MERRRRGETTMTSTTIRTFDFGNGETASHGVTRQDDGTWLALTFTQSRTFRTEKGARAWYARVTGR